jgi:hypothetical protein
MRDPKTAQGGFDSGQIARLLNAPVSYSRGNCALARAFNPGRGAGATETEMGRGLLLWLIGIPLPIILVVWLLGGLH